MGHLLNAPDLKPLLAESFLFSIVQAAASTALSVVCGVMAAVGLFRHEFPGKGFYRQAMMLPLRAEAADVSPIG
jgi:ABC-type Fe3+ transport system permease subunit